MLKTNPSYRFNLFTKKKQFIHPFDFYLPKRLSNFYLKEFFECNFTFKKKYLNLILQKKTFYFYLLLLEE